MSLNTILRESLRRLQRSGEQSVFLSEASIAQINVLKNSQKDAQASAVTKAVEVAAKPEVVAKPQVASLTSNAQLNSINNLKLKGSKEAQIETLNASFKSLFPQLKFALGSGALKAKLVFVSELPSADELSLEQLFVGEPGALLDKILKAMGISRSEVYTTTLFKSPKMASTGMNRTNSNTESRSIAVEYLKKELAVIQPVITIILGTSTYSHLLPSPETEDSFSKNRGKVLSYEGFEIIPTFHPAYLLLKNCLETKRLFWEDMMHVMQKLGLPISHQQKAYFLSKS